MNEIYREIPLLTDLSEKVVTEIMFEVASARADGVQLLRFDIAEREDPRIARRISRVARRVLKDMKTRGAIQFFAFPESIENKTTEYEFIVNKYPSLLPGDAACNACGGYVYVKL